MLRRLFWLRYQLRRLGCLKFTSIMKLNMKVSHLHLSPSRLAPDIRSAFGLFPLVKKIMQSTRCENSGISTILNFWRSLGCRQGFLVTSISVFIRVLASPSPLRVMRTKQFPFLIFPGLPFLLEGSQIPKSNRDFGIKILQRCSSRLLSILKRSCLTRFRRVGRTDSMPSISIFSARSSRSQNERNRKTSRGSPSATFWKIWKYSVYLRRRVWLNMLRKRNSRTISSFRYPKTYG
jgi:hypothetical protein